MKSLKGKFISLIVALVGAIIVAGLFNFNRAAISYNQYIVGNLIALFFIPMLVTLIVFRAEPVDFGFGVGSSRRVWVVTGVLFAALLGLMFAVCRWQVFQDYYPLFRHYPEFSSIFSQYPNSNPFTSAPMLMLYAEVSYGMYLFCWEYFFRGFLLFGLSRSIGWSAILVQATAFAFLHYGKPTAEVAASFGAGMILGIIAMNAKSFVPCFVLHWAASISFDLMIVGARPHS